MRYIGIILSTVFSMHFVSEKKKPCVYKFDPNLYLLLHPKIMSTYYWPGKKLLDVQSATILVIERQSTSYPRLGSSMVEHLVYIQEAWVQPPLWP